MKKVKEQGYTEGNLYVANALKEKDMAGHGGNTPAGGSSKAELTLSREDTRKMSMWKENAIYSPKENEEPFPICCKMGAFCV
ncbi:Hypothetical protein SMAX5B_010487 [Scophthalmus maximus]|uniref:Uncharacterized protein n=1 Tax=Scophthalmus maximus TaxID=52904 RepID=A0A2U9BWL5_SCOMX|nr:Hypothetical protein SMAX5B_010487 [Scophthalmus maximus]